MRLRCKKCNGKLGLGTLTSNVYIPERWWWVTYRYCSRECKGQHAAAMQQQKDDKEAVAALFRPP